MSKQPKSKTEQALDCEARLNEVYDLYNREREEKFALEARVNTLEEEVRRCRTRRLVAAMGADTKEAVNLSNELADRVGELEAEAERLRDVAKLAEQKAATERAARVDAEVNTAAQRARAEELLADVSKLRDRAIVAEHSADLNRQRVVSILSRLKMSGSDPWEDVLKRIEDMHDSDLRAERLEVRIAQAEANLRDCKSARVGAERASDANRQRVTALLNELGLHSAAPVEEALTRLRSMRDDHERVARLGAQLKEADRAAVDLRKELSGYKQQEATDTFLRNERDSWRGEAERRKARIERLEAMLAEAEANLRGAHREAGLASGASHKGLIARIGTLRRSEDALNIAERRYRELLDAISGDRPGEARILPHEDWVTMAKRHRGSYEDLQRRLDEHITKLHNAEEQLQQERAKTQVWKDQSEFDKRRFDSVLADLNTQDQRARDLRRAAGIAADVDHEAAVERVEAQRRCVEAQPRMAQTAVDREEQLRQEREKAQMWEERHRILVKEVNDFRDWLGIAHTWSHFSAMDHLNKRKMVTSVVGEWNSLVNALKSAADNGVISRAEMLGRDRRYFIDRGEGGAK